MTAGVYLLRDPINGIVRYVGQSKDVYARYVQHLRAPPGYLMAQWLAECKQSNVLPELVLVYATDCAEARDKLEGYWIDYYYPTLFNLKLGGGLWRNDCHKILPPTEHMHVLQARHVASMKNLFGPEWGDFLGARAAI